MNQIREFIDVNRIKQRELALYLGIGEPSVSKMAKGHTKPSKENLRKLLENERGWDTSMLIEPEQPQVQISHFTHSNVVGQGKITIGRTRNVDDRPQDDDLVPVIPTNLYKENDVNILEFINDEDNVVPLSPAVQQFPKTDLFYTVQTMAMYPHLHQGDILALKAVKRETPIVNGELYAIDTIDLGILVRFTYDRGDQIELRGSEDEHRFEPFFVKKQDVYNIFRVVGLVRTNI